ncbi:archaellin/type IV pilin N-terminal domain-containing protein [Infirmifilum sp. NZ]|uniref:archaellin/type IV pilin N-terminal domain-containing protein n=1 Tax=Infirmifilum sp. NZ TaxID=2926850 RepID=UPI0027A9728C|nr:archaellin/type IV pilin N-terminal domain-containing protein [Infirmifilum sp. NZ]UNQ73462.1 hypothetical protein MOV14_00265 [Infirmifilum sp. NZ]
MAKRQAISPVIATVIIVAVTIAVAIAVAFWMTGIIGIFTGFEQLTIETIYAQPEAGGWTVTLIVSNKGTSPTSITDIFINGVKAGGTGCPVKDNASIIAGTPLPIDPGSKATILLTIPPGSSCGATKFVAGQSIEVKLHSSGGKDYPKLVVLP